MTDAWRSGRLDRAALADRARIVNGVATTTLQDPLSRSIATGAHVAGGWATAAGSTARVARRRRRRSPR
jgi:hypothetical protein